MNYIHICCSTKNGIDTVWGIIMIGEYIVPQSVDINDFVKQEEVNIVIGEHVIPQVIDVVVPEKISKFVTFWGSPRTKLKTKVWEGEIMEAERLFLKKTKKEGFHSIGLTILKTLYSDFEKDLKNTKDWKSLKE